MPKFFTSIHLHWLAFFIKRHTMELADMPKLHCALHTKLSFSVFLQILLPRSQWNRPQRLPTSVLDWSLFWPGKRAISNQVQGSKPHLKSGVGAGHLMGMQPPPQYTEFIEVRSSSRRNRAGAKPFHMRILIDPLSKKSICFRMLNHTQSQNIYLQYYIVDCRLHPLREF
jgi:hypothetical protein